MALSADDRLLGEKTDYYCSSSEDEGRDSGDESDPENKGRESTKEPSFIPEAKISEYSGTSANTGPKGVISDWREFKRLETENRETQEQERKALMTKLSMTCRSHLDDEREKQKDEEFMEQFEDFEDEFLKEYRQKRIEEMRKALENVPKFGSLISLGRKDFIDAIDKEKPGVKIVVHIYEDKVEACKAMNGCIACLAKEYPTVKFCKMKASDALSKKFSVDGVPALLVYKSGEIVGNFIRLTDEFGEDFYATDVESFLQEHGILPEQDTFAVKDQTTGEIRGPLPQDDDDSDFDVD